MSISFPSKLQAGQNETGAQQVLTQSLTATLTEHRDNELAGAPQCAHSILSAPCQPISRHTDFEIWSNATFFLNESVKFKLQIQIATGIAEVDNALCCNNIPAIMFQQECLECTRHDWLNGLGKSRHNWRLMPWILLPQSEI